MSWQEIAKSLPIGQSRKISCCSEDRTSYVSQDKHGLRMGPCFRCGDRRFVRHGPRSVAEILAARQAVEEAVKLRSIPARALPMSHPETPTEAILWVLSAGISPELAETKYGMRYDPVTGRVCIPIPQGFLARAVFDEKPKYIKAGASRTEMYELISYDESLVVMTEDILSAIAVNRAGYNSIAALGTAVTEKIAARLGKFSNIIVWTDADKAGDNAWITMRKRMGLYPTCLKRIRTQEDPKNINRAEICQRVKDKL